jgi:hypothetical protein
MFLRAACFASLLFLTFIHMISHISASDFLSVGSSLSVMHVLHSPHGIFSCGFYNISPNSSTFSIWFSESYSYEKNIVWSANPLHPVDIWGSRVKLHNDGSMVLEDYDGQTVWTNNATHSDAKHVQA